MNEIDEFRMEGYQRHNRARLEHLASLGLDLENKTVLELGAGIGDHTGFWLERGCEVLCIEGRKENCERLAKKGGAMVVHHNLDSPKFPFAPHQIIYAYGILYHLQWPSQAIRQWSDCCEELLLLETCVDPMPGIHLRIVEEDRGNPTGALNGLGCRPTREWLFWQARRHFNFVYFPRTQPDHEEFPVDWQSFTLPPKGLVRAVLVASHFPLGTPSQYLLDYVPHHQTRYTAIPCNGHKNG